MPSGHLNERTVQEAAIEWLEDESIARPGIIAAVSKDEVRVRKNSKLGWGRTDGLIAAQVDDGSIFTASIEAKSSRTN